jgi:glycosyltransferase involved in cell wall biosynthesis
VAYTPESFGAAGKMLGGKWAQKLNKQDAFISLGFHPDEFFFDQELREAKRVELGFSDEDKVVITATRLRPEKNLEAVIPAFENAESNVKWLLLGSADDEYAQELKSKLSESIGPDRFTLLSHQNREDLNAFYNAADLALFTTPAISIIEAMGTGIIINAPYFKSLEHLGSSVNFITDLNEAQEVSLMFLSDSVESRIARNKANIERFSWRKVTSLLIKDK